MKITKDRVGNVILNNGAHRVVLSAALVQAIGEQVYADSPRAECEGRMVVVALPSVKVAIRPGATGLERGFGRAAMTCGLAERTHSG